MAIEPNRPLMFPAAGSVPVPKYYGKAFSRLLWEYFRGPNHPSKLRLWSLVRRMTGYPRIAIPYAGGFLTIDERDFLQRVILSKGFYEPEVWECLAAAAKENEVFWDVGGHIGSMSVRALLDPRFSTVRAFEPDPIQAATLRLNLGLNGSHGTVHTIALGDQDCDRTFYRATGTNSGLSSLKSFKDATSFDVRCATVDHLVFVEGFAPPTLMKIDVEGWERQVLAGAERLFATMPPRLIVFESACDSCGCLAQSDLAAYLQRFHYQIERIERPSGVLEEFENYAAFLVGHLSGFHELRAQCQ